MGTLKKLTLDEVLSVLDKVEQHGEQWKALCPAHDDNKSSLSIKRGKDGEAVCNCFAGCTPSEVFKALYSKLGFSPIFEESEAPHVVARYDYTDQSGKVVNTKVRKSNKDFYWTKKGIKALPLFNLQGVIENELIFIVEGEKDVLTLKKLGYGATSDRDGLTLENAITYLSGKEIIIIPDNDKAGQGYANKAETMLKGIAKSIKVIDLRRVWSDIPPKGDISDYVEKGYSIDKIIELARAPEPEELTDRIISEHPHFKIWESVEGFGLNEKNQIIFESNNQPLLHGSIIIKEIIKKNDGEEDSTEFKCEGITEAGEILSEVTISVEEFDSLKWISLNWGCDIVTFGGQTTNQKLVSGIKLTGQKAKVTYKRTHTGYVNDKNGKPIAYLHAGGSIGNKGIVCELDDVLSQYMLSECSTSEDERKEAFLSSLSMLQAHKESVTYPLLSFIYLAPIAQINKEVNGESGFCLYLRGKTQNGKSTLSALAMSHFGRFTSTTPPTSFESTARYNEYMSSLLKDSVLWVDDFHPKGTKGERDKQNEMFNKISRASGDRAFRGRLNSNAESGKIYIPRCLYLVTGEDYPQLSQSGLARIFTLEVKTERKNLTTLFQASRNGLLSRAMSDYISYIIEHYEEAKRLFEKHYNDVISYARKELGENRLSIQSALLISSLGLWLFYAISNKLIDRELAEKIEKDNRTIIMKIAHKNEEEIKASDPVEKFINTLSTMINNREVEVRDVKNGSEDNELFGNTYTPRIGWYDEEFYYLDSGITYRAVKGRLESVDDSIGAGDRALFRDMLDQGKIIPDKVGNYTRLKNINGKPHRVLFIRRTVLDIKDNTQ